MQADKLDEHARRFLYDLLGEKLTCDLMEMPGFAIDTVIVNKIRERGRQERRRPRRGGIDAIQASSAPKG